MIRINEIFAGIEGEGTKIGMPQIFIRTQGCSVGCAWCDTKYATTKKGGKEVSVEEIVASLEKNNLDIKRVSITGGNPLEQPELPKLIAELNKRRYEISIECTGQEYNEEVFRNVHFISCDIKPPSSKVTPNFDVISKLLSKFDINTQFKVVVSDDKDLEFAIEVYEKFGKTKHTEFNMVITPCWSEKDKGPDLTMIKKIQNTILKNNMRVRMIVQQHKVLWGPETKGV